MEWSDLGFDAWFEARSAPLHEDGLQLARVTAVDRNACRVRTAETETHAVLTGKFRFNAETNTDYPCVGDWVGILQPSAGGPATVHALLPRKTFLQRKSPGDAIEIQMIAANIDIALIVMACGFDFNLARLDRYLVTACEGGIEPWVILTKTDLIAQDELDQSLRSVRKTQIAACVLPVSNETGDGFQDLCNRLEPRKTYCLLGSSGVGKTTLINRLTGNQTLHTKAVSSTGEGVHTTTRRNLLVLPGGALLIDTPGMRELGLVGTGNGIGDTFADINELATRCRFPDCSHKDEPGCAAQEALQNGTLEDTRFRSFIKLRKETAFHDLSYAEKRQRDRSFGKMVKKILTQKNKAD